MSRGKIFTLAIDKQFQLDVIKVADVLFDNTLSDNQYSTMAEAVEDVLMILLELWLLEEDHGYDMLASYLGEAEGGIEYENSISALGRISECRPTEFPETSESIEVLRDYFEYSVSCPDHFPVNKVILDSTGYYLFVHIQRE